MILNQHKTVLRVLTGIAPQQLLCRSVFVLSFSNQRQRLSGECG